jgi:uncharacterized Zn finger protein
VAELIIVEKEYRSGGYVRVQVVVEGESVYLWLRGGWVEAAWCSCQGYRTRGWCKHLAYTRVLALSMLGRPASLEN